MGVKDSVLGSVTGDKPQQAQGKNLLQEILQRNLRLI